MNLNESRRVTPISDLDIYSEHQGNELIREVEMRYSFENYMIKAVSQGNYKALKESLSADVFINNVEVRTKDEIRNLKNYMIIFNTLMRKGAEVGKVHPFYIHGLSSGFAVRIEDAKTKKDIELLWNEMTYAYCRLVKKHAKRGYSPLVQNVVMLIDADLNEDLTLKTFANKFNVNASYLSSLFKKDTGLTLTEYVNRKRVEKGKELLENTSLQIQSVARLCGVVDVNYYVKLFKKYTDMTPGQYRENNKAEHEQE